MTSLGSFTPTYDNNGNLANDNVHSYAWDADGRPTTLDGVTLTFDALDRMVEEKSTSGFTYQDVYSPTGAKLVYMNGQSFLVANIPLLGGAKAIYRSATNVEHYHHSDWLGTSRLSSSPSQTFVASSAFAPFGEPYASSSNADLFFTGQPENTSSGIYDFMYREYPWQGRWPSPDPAGLAAVDPANPQSWNRYSYVTNNPLEFIDPLGLNDCEEHADCENIGLGLGATGQPGQDLFGGQPLCDVLGCDPWDGRPTIGIGGGANGVRGGYTTVLVYLPGFSIDEYAPGTDPAGYGGYFDSADYLNFLVWVPGGSDSGGGNSSGGPNPAIGQSILKGIGYQLRYAVVSEAVKYICGSSPWGAVKSWVETGAVKGATLGAWLGFAGGEIAGGFAGVPGAVVGGVTGGTTGAAVGLVGGWGAAGVCAVSGVYGK